MRQSSIFFREKYIASRDEEQWRCLYNARRNEAGRCPVRFGSKELNGVLEVVNGSYFKGSIHHNHAKDLPNRYTSPRQTALND